VITKTVNKGAWQLFCLQDGIAAALLARLASKTAAHTLTLALMIFVIASKIADAEECDVVVGHCCILLFVCFNVAIAMVTGQCQWILLAYELLLPRPLIIFGGKAPWLLHPCIILPM